MKRQPNTIGSLAVALICFHASFPALPCKRIPRRRGSATAEWLGIGGLSEFSNENEKTTKHYWTIGGGANSFSSFISSATS